MNSSLIRFATLALLGVCAGVASAQSLRLEAWGRGPSQFEAVKAAYKTMLTQALGAAVDEASTLEGSIRRAFEREIEEDLLRVRTTYFPQSAPPSCTRTNAEFDYGFECQVTATANMDEINARIGELLQTTGASAAAGTFRLAMIAGSNDTEMQDLVAWLHSQFERDLGYDIYRSDAAVDPGELRDGCDQYRKLADEYLGRGANFRVAAERYLAMFDACNQLADRDLIIAIDGVESRFDPFVARDGSMPGELRVRMRLLQVASPRPLAAPPPQTITQYGYGDNAAMAQSNLRDRLYSAAANFVGQQVTAALVNLSTRRGGSPGDAGEREYRVAVTGVNTDSPEDRAKLRLVADWFQRETNYVLETDFTQGGPGERIYYFMAARQPNWASIIDEMYGALDEAGTDARLDVDRSGNLTVAFIAETGAAPIVVNYEHSRARSRIEILENAMEVRRRDPETGTAITINEASVVIRNDGRSDLVLSVTPRWIGQDGTEQPAMFSYEQYLRLPARSSERFTFRAPSRFAERVELDIDCPAESCVAPR